MKKFWFTLRSFKVGVILLLWIGICQSIFLFAQSDLEKKKIEFLLHEVEHLKGAKFWRNGALSSPAEATEYLRMKMTWNDRGRPIKTAKDFIARIGSKSTITGKSFFIQFEDGKKIEMKTFLEQKLSEWKDTKEN